MTTLLVFIAGACFGFGFACYYVNILDRAAQALQARQRKEGPHRQTSDVPEGTLAEGGVGEVTPPSHLHAVRDTDRP